MKNLPALFVFIFLSGFLLAQSPQSFKYQAVVRDATGLVIPDQNVGIRISILQGSVSGPSVYTETHSPATNSFGLVNLDIGGGSVVSGDFTTIPWGTDQFFVQIELDETGGTAYQLMGISQLISVPYALFANEAGNVVYSDTSAINEIQNLTMSNDTLYLSGSASPVYFPYSTDTNYWEKTGNDLYYQIGNVRVGNGNVTPVGRLQVLSDTLAGQNDVIFSVQNAAGDTVFAVYQEGVRIWVADDTSGTKANGSRGGFAVGGLSPAKAIGEEFFRVTPDSVRVYIKEGTGSKASGSRGGFAVGGLSPAKGYTDYYFNIEHNNSPEIIDPSMPRILWYPYRQAFRAGKVLIEDIDSVGINSFATGFESKAIGNYSQAFGYKTRAYGENSTAIGYYANADSINSFAFGNYATAKDSGSYALGTGSYAGGLRSFAVGSTGLDTLGVSVSATKALGDYSYAFGMGSVSQGQGAFAFGIQDTAAGDYSLAMGYQTKTNYMFATAMGWQSKALGHTSTAMGWKTTASGPYSTSMGVNTSAIGSYCTAMGRNTVADGQATIAMGYGSSSSAWYSTAMGMNTIANGNYTTAMGRSTTASGENATAMGYQTTANGDYSLVSGRGSAANGNYSLCMGFLSTADNYAAVAIGVSSIASGQYSMALGYENVASNNYSLALGYRTKSTGGTSTTLGYYSAADGYYTFAMGSHSRATGSVSFAGGYYTVARAYAETVFGRYNDTSATMNPSGWSPTDPVFVIGNGTSNTARHNAVMVKKDGSVYFPDVYSDVVGGAYRDLYITTNGMIGYISSSKRYKKNIRDMESVEWIYDLRPVNYIYKNDDEKIKQYGLIAEEVEKVNPLFVSYNADGKPETVSYSQFISPLIQCIQDQKNEIYELQQKLENYGEIEERLEKLEEMLNMQTKKNK